jgi:hypothetical protein
MKQILKEEITQVKLDIKTRYLAGQTIPSIAKVYDVGSRTIYYHLGELSPEEKGLHSKNSYLRKQVKLKNVKKEVSLNVKFSQPKQSVRVRTNADPCNEPSTQGFATSFGEQRGGENQAKQSASISTGVREEPISEQCIENTNSTTDSIADFIKG